jgi:hypothetical protein
LAVTSDASCENCAVDAATVVKPHCVMRKVADVAGADTDTGDAVWLPVSQYEVTAPASAEVVETVTAMGPTAAAPAAAVIVGAVSCVATEAAGGATAEPVTTHSVPFISTSKLMVAESAMPPSGANSHHPLPRVVSHEIDPVETRTS